MQKTFEAVYEDGVLRPLKALGLADRQLVQVTIVAAPDVAGDIAAYFEPEEWEASKHDQISLDEVRHALSSIRGSLSDAVIASRNERF
jgi:predicted DNA-binding antitoxin AbrB/MazE fold protein